MRAISPRTLSEIRATRVSVLAAELHKGVPLDQVDRGTFDALADAATEPHTLPVTYLDNGQLVSEIPNRPGRVRTGRAATPSVIHRSVDPFAGIPGAHNDNSWGEHVHDYTNGPCCGQDAPSWVRSDTLGLLDDVVVTW